MLKFTSTYPRATRVMTKFKDYIVKASKANLLRGEGGRFSGNRNGALLKSIKGKINKKYNRGISGRFAGGSNMPSLTVSMLDYGRFVDEGVKGAKDNKVSNKAPYKFSGRKKTVPVDNIKSWCNKRGLSEKLAYIIAKSVYEKGIKRSEFFIRPFEKRFPTLVNDYTSAVSLDIAHNFANQIQKKLNQSNLSKKK